MDVEQMLAELVGEFKAKSTGLCWGIDLGTTNSTVTSIKWRGLDAEAHCLEIDQETLEGRYASPLISSVVAIREQKTWVGEGARRLAARPAEHGLVPERNLFLESKNEMGTRKTYHKAPPELNKPYLVASAILRFIRDQAAIASTENPKRTVVTVPASFQLNQRRDTLEAAKACGLNLRDFDLLEEPTAALIYFLVSQEEIRQKIYPEGESKVTVVFDFGGGTCDVSIAEISKKQGQLRAVSRANSRYHRLGGGDLDSAIVHEVLLPLLFEENSISAQDLSWSEKKRILEPQLRGVAEALKIGLCRETRRLKGLGKYGQVPLDQVAVRQPGLTCKLGKNEYPIRQPRLSAAQWEHVLLPYLDADLLYPGRHEYFCQLSIFAPIADALERAGTEREEVAVVLLAGGSSSIPQIKEAIQRYFSSARILEFPDESQTAISAGAAWHAYFLEATLRPFIQPVLGTDLALRLDRNGSEDFLTLVEADASLPYPADGSFAQVRELSVPEKGGNELLLDVVGGNDHQTVFRLLWKLPESARGRDPITFEYRITANQDLECRAFLSRRPDEVFERTVENPLIATVNPNETRSKIEAIEEEFRQRGGVGPDDCSTIWQLARLYAELNQYERAIEWLQTGLRKQGRPDDGILNLMGIYYGQLGDKAREEKHYRAACDLGSKWDGPWFNLALLLWRKKEMASALQTLRRCLELDPDSAPTHVFMAELLNAQGKKTEASQMLGRAWELFDEPEDLSEFELSWLTHWGEQSQREDIVQKARTALRRLKTGRNQFSELDGLLPALGI